MIYRGARRQFERSQLVRDLRRTPQILNYAERRIGDVILLVFGRVQPCHDLGRVSRRLLHNLRTIVVKERGGAHFLLGCLGAVGAHDTAKTARRLFHAGLGRSRPGVLLADGRGGEAVRPAGLTCLVEHGGATTHL